MIDLAPAIRAAAEALHAKHCPAGPDCDTDDLGTWLDGATTAVNAVAKQLIEAGAETERLRIFGDEDETVEGIFDRVRVKVVPHDLKVGRPHPIMFLRCEEGCGHDGTGTVLVIARDLDGNQRNLTMAELGHQILHHFDCLINTSDAADD